MAAVLAVLLALAAQAPLAAQADRAPAGPAALPTAAQVLARYRTAIGGTALIKKYKSRKSTGRFELPAQGISGPVEVVAAAPDRMRLKIELGALGVLQRGYDGHTGWAIDPAIGPRIVQGAELDEMRHSADFYYDLHDPASFQSITFVERGPFEGHDCYTLKVVRTTGFEVLEYYDVATGLLDGFRMSSTSAMGTVPGVVTVLDAYKRFGGLLTPTVARQRAMGIESVLTLDTVELDTVPDDAFALPPEIRALVK